MGITLKEGRFDFTFDGDAMKFDDKDGYYGKRFTKLQGGKGVDFIAFSADVIQLIEVKDFCGREIENLWRIADNSPIPKKALKQNKDRLYVEVAKKVASTIACLYGAWTMELQAPALASKLTAVGMRINDKQIQIPSNPHPLQVVLFMEGNFNIQSRTKKAIMEDLQKKIGVQLSWLNCTVSVIDSEQCRRHNSGFAVTAT